MIVELAFLVAVVGSVFVVGGSYWDRKRRELLEQRMNAGWRILIEGTGTATSVYVFRDVHGRVLDRILIARIDGDDPDLAEKLQDAQAQAEELIPTLEIDHGLR